MKINKNQVASGTYFHRFCSCLLLTLVILLLTNCTFMEAYGAEASPFSDVHSGEWFSEAVLRAKEEGVLDGYPDGSFRPGRTVTYGEFLRMAVKNAPTKRQGHWAGGYYEEGISRQLFTEEEVLKGALDKCISRKYMALVFARLLDQAGATQTTLNGNEAESEAMSTLAFADIDSRSAFKPYIEQSAAVGLLTGYPDHTFRPEKFLTRAEAAVAFVRLSDILAAAEKENRGTGEAKNENSGLESAEAKDSIEDVMDPAYKAYLDSILESLRVSGSRGNYKYSFEIPQAPEESKVFFKVIFFSKTGAQILIDQTYISRDSSPRTVENQIQGLHSLSGLGSALFDFGIIPKVTDYWHDYMLIWEASNGLSLRTDYWKRNTNKGFSEYSTRALDYAFSWQ